MIRLNIIPNSIKKEIKNNFIFNIVKKSFYILIIVFSIFGIALLISEHILLSTLAKEINSSSLDFKSSANSSQNLVNDINNKLLLLDNVQGEFIRWSVLINYISQRTPTGLTFSSIKIDKSSASVSLKGISKDRDSLLTFKDSLESSNIFSNIEFPVQNLLQKENINFDIKAKINPDEIR